MIILDFQYILIVVGSGYVIGFRRIVMRDNVKLYSATEMWSCTTVSDRQYITRNNISINADGCSVDHKIQDAKDVGWITIPAEHNNIRKRRKKIPL